MFCPSDIVDVSFRVKEQAQVRESETAPADSLAVSMAGMGDMERTEEVLIGEEEV